MAQNNVPDWVTKLDAKRQATAKRVIAEAQAQGVPRELALGMAMQESGFDQSKKSKTGPTGVMMLGKAAAKDMGVNRYNEAENIRGGVKYMKMMLDKYNNDVDKALIAYHDGPNSNYFTTGQASPAALNHIQKVRGYAGYQPTAPQATQTAAPQVAQATQTAAPQGVQPMAKENKLGSGTYQVAPLDLDALDEIDKITRQDSNRFLSPFVQGAGVVGAIAGATLGQDKPKSGEKFQAEVSQSKIPMQAAQIRNQGLQAQYDADVRAHNDALKLRKELMDSAAKVQGADISNWSLGQYRGAIPFVEGQEALSMKEAGAMGEEGVKKERQAKAMMPGVQFDKTTGLMLPPNATPTPPPQIFQQHPLLQGLPQYPAPLALERVPTPKPVSPGSRFGQGANAVSGGLAGIQAADAYQRGANDPVGAGLGAISSAGFGATAAGNPKVKALGAAAGVIGGAAQKVWDVFNTKDQTKSVLQPTGEPPKYKKGGAIKKPVGGLSAVEHFDGGGRTGLAKTIAGKIAGAFGQPPGQLVMPTAEEIAKFAPKPTQQLKFSEAIRPYQDQYLGVHMSDRQGVHGGRWGGTGFPNFQNINPIHSANKAVWMNDSEEAANKLIQTAREFNGRPMINTNYIGAPDQHRSNKTVFNDVLDTFYKNQAAGQVTPEQIEKINQAILSKAKTTGTLKNLPFNDKFDIRDKDAVKAIAGQTFEGRKAIGDLLGMGLGTRKPATVPQYANILEDHADPFTKGAPTSAVGTRLFSVDNVPAQYTDDVLHPDYRWKVTGEDKQVQFPAVPQSIAVRDWYNEIKPRIGMEPHGNAWFSYPKRPQLISKDYITMAEDAGYAEGGQVQHFDKGGRTGVLTRLGESAYDLLKLTPEKVEAWRKANAKPFKQQQDPQLAQALEAYMTGKISQADYLRIMNERRPIRPLTELPKAHSNEDIVSALDSNKVNRGILGLNLQVPEGMRVGNRLDIPAYERYGVYVDTMHDPAGKPIGYGHTGHLKDVEFKSDPNKAIRVGLGTRPQGLTPLAAEEGADKGPFAMMMGNQQTTKDEEVRRMLAEALQDPTWRQIGMNPYRGSQFYDKADMQPVFSAAEKIQAGPLVLARDVEKTSWKDPRLKTRYGVNYAKGGLTHL
jgi:hypothetical protein